MVTNDAASTSESCNVIRLFGTSENDCGYCRGERAAVVNRARETSSRAYTIVADNLQPSVYEAFVCRGWRRSGEALYKPDNWNSCCPTLTIRLPVQQFTPSKSQKKVLRRMEAILAGEMKTATLHPGATAAALPKNKSRAELKGSTKTLQLYSKERMQQYLQDSGILQKIQEATSKALTEVLLQLPPPVTVSASVPSYKLVAQGPQNGKVKAKEIGKSEQPKQQQPAEHAESADGFTSVILMSTICANIAGRSKGAIDVRVLSQNLVDALVAKFVDSANYSVSPSLKAIASDRSSSEEEGSVDPNAYHKRCRVDIDSSVAVEKIERHATSGQIFIHLKVRNDVQNHSLAESPSTEVAMDVAVENATTSTSSTVVEDELATWWKQNVPNVPLQQTPPYDLNVTTLPAHESALCPDVHVLYWKYQTAIHGDADPLASPLPPSEDDSGDGKPLVNHAWGGKSPAGWRERADSMLEHEYQHLPEARRRKVLQSFIAFYDFLVESPFSPAEAAGSHQEMRLGTYHQHYRIANGLLIAVGVIDVLPQGLSSVYLYYDPSFSDHLAPLGKYSILREIDWARETGLPYYYLGYYIESCPKMRYKAEYRPSQLLCPTTYTWVDAEIAKEKLLRESPVRHCCTLAADPNTSTINTTAAGVNPESNNHHPEEDVDASLSGIAMMVEVGETITLDMLTADGQAFVRPLLREFAEQAGPQIAMKCVVDFRP